MPDVDLLVLKTELTTDPLLRGYAAMTNAQAATSLNTANRLVERSIVSAALVDGAVTLADWTALNTANKQLYQTMISGGEIDMRSANNRSKLIAMFGAATTSRANLIALQNESNITRAAELGLPFIGEHHVAEARALP